MNENIVVLIPAYEPTTKFLELLKDLKKYNLQIIIVNDGSGKKYNSIFKEAHTYGKIITHLNNEGKGAALKTGLKYITEFIKKDCIIVTMDCDGQHKVEDALILCSYASKEKNCLVLGKRLRSNKTPLRSRLGNIITRFFYRITTGVDVYDTQTGLRAFSNSLIPFLLKVEGERFEYEMNVLLKCPGQNIKIKEIEIETIYIDNNSHSHFKTIKDSFLVYKEIFKFLMSSIISFIIDYLAYLIFIFITNNLVISNIIARIISSTCNYNINKRIVFNNKEQDHNQLLKYYVLASIILIFNTIILNFLVYKLLINKLLAKIITELILVTLSWLVQKKIIFYKKDDKYEKN